MIRSTNNNPQLAQILTEKVLDQASISEAEALIQGETAHLPQTEQGIRTERQQSRAIENLTAQILQKQFLKMDATAVKKAVVQESQMPLSDLSAQIRNLAQHLQGLPESDPMLEAFQQLDMILSQAQNLSLPSEMDTHAAFDMLGAADQAEKTLHQTISEKIAQPAGNQSESGDPIGEILRQFAMILSALQGRPGQLPLGYSPDAFDPKKSGSKTEASKTGKSELDPESQEISEEGEYATEFGSGDSAAHKKRLEEAKKLKDSGGLAGGKIDESKKPKVSEEEQKNIDARIAAADDEEAERISNDPALLAKLSPEQKAKLVKQLMDGDTDGSQDCSIARICASVNSKAEWDKVTELAGGHLIFDELDNDQAKGWFKEAESKWINAEKEAAGKALDMLEKCETPEEARELATELGGLNLKHQIKDPEHLKRLEAVAKRFNMPKLGYGLPPEKVKEYREAFGRAAMYEDSGLAVRLSEDKDAMKVATPNEKAKLIKELQRGWTKDHQDAAIKRILLSCKDKAEFDELVNLVGGKSILNDMDDDESKEKINKLMGGWGRTELADDPALAKQHENILADPKKRAEYTATRKPTQEESAAVGGEFKMDPNDANDPLMQTGNQAAGKVKKDMARDMYALDEDPQAENELAIVQRDREVKGQPKLDFTELTAEANRIASAPDFDQKVQEYAQRNDLDLKEAREKYMTEKMDTLRVKYGLTEQEMSGLVTKRMAHIYGKGAEQMNGYSQAIVGPLKQQLAVVERTLGPNSPEATALRAQIAKFEKSTGAFTQHLSNVSESARSMYPVPTSFAEDFVAALGPIADIAMAVVTCVPGVGQVIGGIYFGVKAVVSAAKGDVLGMFSSMASALPGVGAAIGGATGAALNTAGRLGQAGIGFGKGVADGNVLGAFGSMAGFGSGPAIEYAKKTLALADGISRGDFTGILNGASGVLGPAIGNNPVVQQVTQYSQKAAPLIDAIASGDASKAFGIINNELGPLVANNPDAARVLGLVNDGVGFVNALNNGDYGRAVSGLLTNHELLNAGPGAGFVNSLGQVSNLIGALGSGNPQQLVDVLRGENGFLQVIGGGALSQSIGQISDSANQILSSPEFQMVNDLTRSGSRFLNTIANGDLRTTLNNFLAYPGFATPEVRQLLGMLGSTQPLIQSMLRGEYQTGLAELRKNPLTANVGDQFGIFEPFAEMVQGDARRSLETYRASLAQLVELRNEMEHFEKLEESTRQLQKRFGEDFMRMAQYLIQHSGYRAPQFEQISA